MKLVTFLKNKKQNLGVIVQQKLYNLGSIGADFPSDILVFLDKGETVMQSLREKTAQLINGEIAALPESDFQLIAPVPHPRSCRDGYAFRQHVAAARRNRGVDMIKEFDQYPVFYFTNHQAIQGPGDVFCMPDHFQQLDFELEVAIVIGKQGKNIQAKDADEYIAGFTIMNDMSARKLQMEEMLLNLGPAKGKDFSTVIGPWLVTPDELKPFLVPPKNGHIGNSYNLSMKCWVNNQLVSEGNMADMDWTFAEIIERCSYGVTLYPGEVIGSGTVGTGCFLELNGTGMLHNPDYQPQWLKEGDEVKMTIDGLGTLENTIRAEQTDWSILALKK